MPETFKPYYPSKKFPELLDGHSHKFLGNNLVVYWRQDEQDYVVSPIESEDKYTARDYLDLPENSPYQLINAKLVYMASPTAVSYTHLRAHET